MPPREVHDRVLEALGLGEYKIVNEIMDANARLFGPAHRLFPMHDPVSGIVLFLMTGDIKVLIAHIVHNLTDLLGDPIYFINYARQIVETAMSIAEKVRILTARRTRPTGSEKS